MTKRARGTVRPGQRRPIQRRTTGNAADSATPAAAPAPKPTGLTEAEAARAAELEANLLAEERAAEATRRQTRVPRAERDVVAGGTLAQRAQAEYAYVARDMRDILRISALLFGTLFGLWILIDVVGVFG